MDAHDATRTQHLLAEGHVAPEIFHEVMPRLATFRRPFVRTCCRQEPAQPAHPSVDGWLSDLERKNVESLAYRFGHDRLPLQRVVGWAAGEAAPVRQALRRQVAPPLGHANGVVVVDPSAFPTSGTDAVGVARQWCGRLGKVAHGQVALYLGDGSGAGHTWVDMRLSLPHTWTQDTARRDKAGVPHDRRGYRSRHPLALDMLEHNGAARPHGWIAGEDERGRPYWLRRRLARLGERSRLAVPGHTWLRDREAPPPA